MTGIRTQDACHKASARELGDADLTITMRYLNDPHFHAAMRAEQAEQRNKCNAAIDAGLAKYRAERGIL